MQKVDTPPFPSHVETDQLSGSVMEDAAAEPRVSLLIVSYNQQDYIHEAIDSALAQTYSNFEIIIADDGSTDATSDIIRSYAAAYPDKILPVLNDINRGITANCNSGLRKASGKYFTHFGGDDTLQPTKLREQVACMEANPELVLCAHQVEVFYDKEERSPHLLGGVLTAGSGPDQLLRHGGLAALSVMARMDALPEHGFESRLPMISDYMLWAEVLAGGGKYEVLSSILGRYRQHLSNITRDWTKYAGEVYTYYTLFEERYPHYRNSCRYGLIHHALYDPGVALLTSGRYHDASAYFRRAIYRNPTLLKAWIRYIQSRWRLLFEHRKDR